MVILPVEKNLENSCDSTLFGRSGLSGRYLVKSSVCIDICSSSYYGSACRYTGRFIMFSVITNIYNKKTRGPTLMEFFTATGKLIFFLQLEMFDVCATGDTAHINTIFKFLPHTRQHVDACVTRT